MLLFNLLALSSPAADWQSGTGFRSQALTVPTNGKAGFTLLSRELTGIRFTNSLSLARQLQNSALLNGSGVAAGDVDGDGRCDLYFCGLDGPNVLYRNLGNWKFQDITAEAGVACPNMDASAAALVDLDGDGDLDLVVNSTGGGTHIFINDGKAHFTEKMVLNPNKGGTSLAFGDLDGDGFLDMYVANYRTTMLVDMPQTNFRFKQVDGVKVIATVNGRPVTEPDLLDRFVINASGGIDEQGEVDVLYKNVGGTNFVPVPFPGGAFLDEDGHPLTKPLFEWGLSVMIRDINGDGLPDIYVCNDFDSPDRIWLNQGGGRFRAINRLALRKTSLFSMGIDFADINRDGFDDFFVLDMLSPDHVHRLTQSPDRKAPIPVIGRFDDRPQYSMNSLFLNQGDGTYNEIAQLAGVSASDWSWTSIFLDVDLDGWEDLLIANGHARDARNLDVTDRLRALRTAKPMTPAEILQARTNFPALPLAKLAYRNQHDLTFAEVGKQWGFDTVSVSHGMALADLDNDGDMDVIINNMNSPAGIYRNDSSAPRLAVRLKGAAPNTAGIGAKIKVSGGPVPQSQEIISGGRYLSSDEPLRVFAAGSLTNKLAIEVTWRSGKKSRIESASPNRLYELDEAAATASLSRVGEGQGEGALPPVRGDTPESALRISPSGAPGIAVPSPLTGRGPGEGLVGWETSPIFAAMNTSPSPRIQSTPHPALSSLEEEREPQGSRSAVQGASPSPLTGRGRGEGSASVRREISPNNTSRAEPPSADGGHSLSRVGEGQGEGALPSVRGEGAALVRGAPGIAIPSPLTGRGQGEGSASLRAATSPHSLSRVGEGQGEGAALPPFRTPQSALRTSPSSAPGIASPSPLTGRGQGEGSASGQGFVPNRPPLFTDVSNLIRHTHHEEPFDDFERQPLLPKKLSQLGPGISWSDLDGDGWDDLLIGTGKGGQLSAYHNNGRGGFEPLNGPPFDQPVTRDQTSVLVWRKSADETVLLAGSANYEDGFAIGPCVRQFNLKTKSTDDTLLATTSSVGPLAMADIDGDGDLDLFVGGRVIPGRYPQPASSRLYRNVNGKFEIDSDTSKQLEAIGMISGAVFSDLDGDGWPDLLLACEWGPIRVFHNAKGKFIETTEALGLQKYRGWWNGISTGDFDGDGRLDIVASNWGRNSQYQSHRQQPLRLAFADFNEDDTLDMIEGYYDPTLDKVVAQRLLSFYAKGIPSLRQHFDTYEGFAKATLQQICATSAKPVQELQANWLESTLFLNRGDHFEARPLPIEAQMSPALAICIGDIDGDGNLDLFLSQNFFANQPEIPRYDGGRGLWLRGDGHGGFIALSATQSGVAIYGEQRGAALSDYDGDGRLDLAVTQNGAETKLYHNVAAQPGLRIRLIGPAANPQAIGAVIRVVSDQAQGPAQEIHLGDGYLSQNSNRVIVKTPDAPARLTVRWPGGKSTTHDLPRAAHEIEISESGPVRVTR